MFNSLINEKTGKILQQLKQKKPQNTTLKDKGRDNGDQCTIKLQSLSQYFLMMPLLLGCFLWDRPHVLVATSLAWFVGPWEDSLLSPGSYLTACNIPEFPPWQLSLWMALNLCHSEPLQRATFIRCPKVHKALPCIFTPLFLITTYFISNETWGPARDDTGLVTDAVGTCTQFLWFQKMPTSCYANVP